jgi:isoleucyl-tRNA synthetase
VATLTGADLVGRTYAPLFGFFADNPNSFVVLAGDFIDTAEGTGVVHLAPGFGEDDQRVCEAAGIELVVPVDEKGRFTAEVPDWAGVNVFEANPDVIRHLKAEGRVLRHETYDHNYPHCWRTDTPIIYRAMQSWYVRVTDLTDRLLEPATTRSTGSPGTSRTARSASGSPARATGRSPQPVLGRAHPRVGERRPGLPPHRRLRLARRDRARLRRPPHQPAPARHRRPHPPQPRRPHGQSTMRRVTEVLDCWFESGSMPYAQVHYPFENQEWFETTPRPTSSSSTSPRRAAGSTRCTCCRWRCSTGPRSRT